MIRIYNEKKAGYNKMGRIGRAEEIKTVIADKSTVDKIKADLRLIHIAYSRLEAIRVFMAKHQIVGKPKSIAFMPGYGRINGECGSLEYQLENEAYIIGNISRRDIADEIRALASAEPQSPEELKNFDLFMRGPSASEIEGLLENKGVSTKND
jgi:hypothetical protein